MKKTRKSNKKEKKRLEIRSFYDSPDVWGRMCSKCGAMQTNRDRFQKTKPSLDQCPCGGILVVPKKKH